MKITVDISENDIKDIMRFAGEKKKGPAISKFLASELMLHRRREMSQEVVSGQWTIELPDWQKRRAAEREQSQKLWER